jgi:uncharacterized Tic20 family protein
MEQISMQPSEDDRILAALAHASIIANIVNLAGMIATALIWTSQRERSEYVRQHALQSLLYQGMVLVILIVLMIFWGVCLGLSLLPVALRPDLYRSSPPNSFWIALLGLALPLGVGILATLYGLYGAYQVYRGRPFSYPIAGRFMRRGAQSGAVARPSPPPQPAELVVPAQAAQPAATARDENAVSPTEPDSQAPTVRSEPADQEPGDEAQ